MSWTDKKSIEQIKKLRDRFNIKTFVETGTFRGNNAEVHSRNFQTVLTVDNSDEYYWKAKQRLFSYTNVYVTLEDSPIYLQNLKPYLENAGIVFFYLDAHFYDPALSPEDRWVIMRELRALENLPNCVICIHDFNCNGLGGLIYDKQSLDFELVKDALANVNPKFNYYFNTFDGCDILTKTDVIEGKMPPLILDEDVSETLEFVWGQQDTIRRAYRGILYATPEPLDLTQFELVKEYGLKAQ